MLILADIGFPDVVGALVNLPFQIAILIWYPIADMIQCALNVLNLLYVPIAMVLNSFILIGNTVIALPAQILTNLFPSTWVTIMVMEITIIVALRLYSFVKGITIFGFRIGG